jgi:hypothetical protein
VYVRVLRCGLTFFSAFLCPLICFVSPCSLRAEKQALEQTLHDLTTNGQQASAEDLQNASAMVDKVKAQLGKAYATIKSLKDELARYIT